MTHGTTPSSANDPPVLITETIAKSYEGRRILISASLRLESGQITALLGHSGSGKSTFLRICAGLIPADQGTLTVFDAILSQPGYATLAGNGLYFMPANGSAVPMMTLRQHLSDLQRAYGVNDANDVVQRLDLSKLMDTRMRALSGGERKRANLALAVARNPSILLADEPFRDLDPLMAEATGSVLQDLAKRGCAILVTGHQAETIFDYARSVHWLLAGRIHLLGTPAEAKQHDRFRNEYLAIPTQR